MQEKEKNIINGYGLSRQWFDFVHETSETIAPAHGALYFWIIELFNQLGWREVIGLPTSYSMQAIGLRTYRTYKKALDDLVRWGFIELREKSNNQHTSNQIALALKSKAEQGALALKSKAEQGALALKSKAEQKQSQKQSSHNKTIINNQTNKTLSEEKTEFSADNNFPLEIIKSYLKFYPDEIEPFSSKNFGAAKKIEKQFQGLHPQADNKELIFEIEKFFSQIRGISDSFVQNNISLTYVAGQHTQLRRKINGHQRAGHRPAMPQPDINGAINYFDHEN